MAALLDFAVLPDFAVLLDFAVLPDFAILPDFFSLRMSAASDGAAIRSGFVTILLFLMSFGCKDQRLYLM